MSFAIVIPTIGRATLQRLLLALEHSAGPAPDAVVVVDDRVEPDPPLLTTATLPVKLLRSGGRGPAAARNVGWRSCATDWICFLDDDVLPQTDWLTALYQDLLDAEAAGAVGSQAVIEVPAPYGRRSTDDQRRTQRLADAQWITADMAYRRSALVAVGGFDERFPRAYREDSDLALRITLTGESIACGARRSRHSLSRASWGASVRAQRGNRDDALMRRKHGRGWRSAVGEGRGRLPLHTATTIAAVLSLATPPPVSWLARASWCALTTDFAVRRFLAGRRTPVEAVKMLVTSIVIPPVAVAQRLRGEWEFRDSHRDPWLAVLFDRDDTIIKDIPYLNDPAGVQPVAGAVEAIERLRQRGLLLAVVSNQSGVARGLISTDQLDAVNARVNELMGPFDSWQVCVHAEQAGCGCRKPEPGMVRAAAEVLGIEPRRCVLIGDTGGDVRAALAAGAAAILVPTERTLPDEVTEARAVARVAATLQDAVELVLQGAR